MEEITLNWGETPKEELTKEEKKLETTVLILSEFFKRVGESFTNKKKMTYTETETFREVAEKLDEVQEMVEQFIQSKIEMKEVCKLLNLNFELIKYYISILFERLVLNNLGIYSNIYGDSKKYSESIIGLTQFRERTQSQLTPDFVLEGKIGDVKVDYTKQLDRQTVSSMLKKEYGETVLLMLINGESSIRSQIEIGSQELAISLFDLISNFNLIVNRLRVEFQIVFKEELDNLRGKLETQESKIKTQLENIYSRISENERSKLTTPEIIEYLYKDVYEEDYLDNLMKETVIRTQMWMGKFIGSIIGASEMTKIIRDKYTATNGRNAIVILNDLYNEKIKFELIHTHSLYNKLTEEEKSEIESARGKDLGLFLENHIRENYLQNNITYFPSSAERFEITGKEILEGDNSLIRAVLEIRNLEKDQWITEENRDKISSLKKQIRTIKDVKSKNQEGVNIKNRLLLELGSDLIKEKERINSLLKETKMNSDGSYSFVERKLLDNLRSGVGMKHMQNLVTRNLEICNKCLFLLSGGIFSESLYKKFKRFHSSTFWIKKFIIRLEEAASNLKLSKVKEIKINLKSLHIQNSSEINSECLTYVLIRFQKIIIRESKDQLPQLNFEKLIDNSFNEVPLISRFEMPDVSTENSFDIKMKQDNLNQIISEINEVITKPKEKSKVLHNILADCSISRDIIMAGRDRPRVETKGATGVSIYYSRNNKLAYIVGGRTDDTETGTIQILFKAKYYSRPLFGLKYKEFSSGDYKFYLSKPFKLNFEFTSNWLSTAASALGSVTLNALYGSDITKSNLVLPMLSNPKKSFIECFETVGLISGNLTRNMNFGKEVLETKLDAVTSDIRISNWMNVLITEGESMKLKGQVFFKSFVGKKYNLSRMTTRSSEMMEYFDEKIRVQEVNLSYNTIALDKLEGNRLSTEEFNKRKKLLKEKKKIENQIRYLEAAMDSTSTRIDISSKQVLFTLIYAKQLLMKEIPLDQIKMKDDYFVREYTFNQAAQKDIYSLRHFKEFSTLDFKKFFDFLLPEDSFWSPTYTSLPGFVYHMQRKIINDSNLSNSYSKTLDDSYFNYHPVETAVSSKTNFIRDETEFVYMEAKRKLIEEHTKEANDESQKEIKSAMREKKKQGKNHLEKLIEGAELTEREKIQVEKIAKIKQMKEKARSITKNYDNEAREDLDEILKMKIKKLREKVWAMGVEERSDIINNIEEQMKTKGKDYFRVASSYTADALLRESIHVKKALGLDNDEELAQLDVIVKSIVNKGSDVVLTLELKEQKGSKRAYFVQLIDNRNTNQFWDRQSARILKKHPHDNITVPGNEKYIRMQGRVAETDWENVTGITGDKAKFGDNHPLRPFGEGIKAKFDEGYIDETTACVNMHALIGLLNRKLLLPKALLEKTKKYSNKDVAEEEEKAAFIETKYFKNFVYRIKDTIDLVFDPLKKRGTHPFMEDSKIKGEIEEVANKNLYIEKECGFTLGVLNYEATVIGICSTYFQELINKKYFPEVKMIVQVHSDDTLHLMNTKATNLTTVRNFQRDLETGALSQEAFLNKFSVSALQQNQLGENMTLFQTALYFLCARLVGQVMSLAKTSLAEDYAEMLQVYITSCEERIHEGSSKTVRFANVTAPLIRYTVNMGNRGTYTSYSDSLRQRINAAGDALLNGGSVTLFIALQLLANQITMIEFNMKKSSTEVPPEAGGAIINLPEDFLKFGFKSNSLRLMTNRVGRRALRLIVIDPDNNQDDMDDTSLQGDVSIANSSGGNFKERIINPKINLSYRRVGSSNFSFFFRELGIDEGRLGDTIKELSEELHIEELLGVKKQKIYFLRVMTKHNSKLFNDSRVTLPKYVIERVQTGYLQRVIDITKYSGNDQEVTESTVQSYYEGIELSARGIKEMGKNTGFDLMEAFLEDDIKRFKSNYFKVSRAQDGELIEPNKFIKRRNNRSLTRYSDYILALAFCSELTVELTEEDINHLTINSKTAMINATVIESNYSPYIWDMHRWLSVILPQYWKIHEKQKITGLKDILKLYIEERKDQLIYKCYTDKFEENIILMYKLNFSFYSSAETSFFGEISVEDQVSNNVERFRKFETQIQNIGTEYFTKAVLANEIITNQDLKPIRVNNQILLLDNTSVKKHLLKLLQSEGMITSDLYNGILTALSYLKSSFFFDKKHKRLSLSSSIGDCSIEDSIFTINKAMEKNPGVVVLNMFRFLKKCLNFNDEIVGDDTLIKFKILVKQGNEGNHGEFIEDRNILKYNPTEESRKIPIIRGNIKPDSEMYFKSCCYYLDQFTIFPSSADMSGITLDNIKKKSEYFLPEIKVKIEMNKKFFPELNKLSSSRLSFLFRNVKIHERKIQLRSDEIKEKLGDSKGEIKYNVKTEVGDYIINNKLYFNSDIGFEKKVRGLVEQLSDVIMAVFEIFVLMSNKNLEELFSYIAERVMEKFKSPTKSMNIVTREVKLLFGASGGLINRYREDADEIMACFGINTSDL